MSRWRAVFVEPDDFRSAFFPTASGRNAASPIPQSDNNPFADLLAPSAGGEAMTEAVLCATITKTFNSNNLVPGLEVCRCGEPPVQLAPRRRRKEVDPVALYFHGGQTTNAQRSWADQVMPVWFEKSEINDVDVPTRMMAYADGLFAVQQRVVLFMLVVVGSRAQFMRWDRSGAVVTHAFDYVEDWRFFCDALWRIGHCSAARLGFDPTATRLCDSDADYLKMGKAADVLNSVDPSQRILEDGTLPPGEFEYVRRMFENSITSGWPRYRVEVPGNKGPRKFLISKPEFWKKGVLGRGTRGYVALECDTGRLVWLKDAWRASHEFVRMEGDILADLNQAKVSNVPTLLCHGDIAGQTTETTCWWGGKNVGRDPSIPTSGETPSSTAYVCPSSSTGLERKRDDASTKPADDTERSPLRLHQHYRLVVKEVAMPLDRFEYPRQLIQIVFDCVVAHYEASTKPEPNKCLLHRDISSGNILMYPHVLKNEQNGVVYLQWRGLLADWEMSQPQHKGNGQCKPLQPEQTGTWQYASVALLTPGAKVASLADELESFFHVLLYYAVRYVRGLNCDGEDAANFLYKYFDVYGYEPGSGMYTCGALKTLIIKSGSLIMGTSSGTWAPRFGNPLDPLFARLLSWFAARYNVAYYDKAPRVVNTKQTATSRKGLDIDHEVPVANDEFLVQFGLVEFTPEPEECPSQQERDLARVLESHGGLARALNTALRANWPDEKTKDQIPKAWERSNESSKPLPRMVKNKRRRTRKGKAA
uniref:Vacuolar protein sorting-associated protein 1 n=1 Tax=Ganoderma boninense TaxID=34458 RepID=A0A5K1JUM7_9APHY|nr:Vacuolar protein sorting-associated protein 1 [Ganoderma boninense]